MGPEENGAGMMEVGMVGVWVGCISLGRDLRKTEVGSTWWVGEVSMGKLPHTSEQ
jgi:hypothetical protein